MTMRVGYSFWGLCEPWEKSKLAKTPDGFRMPRPLLVDEMVDRVHEVIFLQQRREEKRYRGVSYALDGGNHGSSEAFPECDVVLLEWRWRTHKNSGPTATEPDWNRQCEILDHYIAKGTKCVVIDTDHKIIHADEDRWCEMIIVDPALWPRTLRRQRIHFPLWTTFQKMFDVVQPQPVYGYVGNRYERDLSFQKYFAEPAKSLRESGVQTSVWGNWLETSPERPSTSMMLKNWQSVAFCPRQGFWGSMEIMNSFICTTHISKDDYYETGFVSPRTFEALQCGIPALIPVEHEALRPLALDGKCLVTDWLSVSYNVQRIMRMSLDERKALVDEQLDALKSIDDYSPSRIVNFLEEIA